MANSCKHGHEPTGSTKVGECLDQPSDYQLLKKASDTNSKAATSKNKIDWQETNMINEKDTQ